MALTSVHSFFSYVDSDALALHLAASCTCLYALSTLPRMHILTGHDIESEYGGHYQFLTIVSLKATQICMALAVASDFLPSLQILHTAKTVIQIGALPLEIMVSLLYWSLVSISPDLLIPPKVYKNADGELVKKSLRLPLMIDLAMHLAPAVWLVIDYLAFSPLFPQHIKPWLISFVVTLSYCAWIEWCNGQNGFFPYPMLSLLNVPRRMAWYVSCGIIMTGVLYASSRMHEIVNPTR